MSGFLGTGATFEADLNLIVQLIMGVALLAGVVLAKQKRYTAHGICQTTVLLLNLLMIGLVMWPSFQQQVKPAL
jgi:Ca2+/H+ antiporter